MPVGDAIKNCRTRAGLTRGELAKYLKMPQHILRAWELNFAKPRLDSLEKLAVVLGVSLADLVDDGRTPTPVPRVLEPSPKPVEVISPWERIIAGKDFSESED